MKFLKLINVGLEEMQGGLEKFQKLTIQLFSTQEYIEYSKQAIGSTKERL